MSEASEKPFDATPARLRKARREGNVARSGELAANLAFAAGALTVVAVAPLQAGAAASAIDTAVTSGTVELNAVASVRAAVLFALALVPAGAAALAGAVGGLAQNGGLAAVAIAPKFERLNPIEGLKRILSRDTVAHSLRAAVAFGCAAAAASPFIAWSAVALLQAPAIAGVAAVTWRAVEQVAFAACAVGCCFALAEYAAARNAWLRKLRMSFEERKRESREEEGDAVARGRRRTLHRALLRGGMHRVKDAAFVVVNPQHVAVALEYRPPRVAVPRVLVRAADAAAIRVRVIALECRIPIVENVGLARTLYRDARAGDAIPVAHYVAVAEVVAALLRSGRIEQS
jgi:flagellar biosynthesis protein FlhB